MKAVGGSCSKLQYGDVARFQSADSLSPPFCVSAIFARHFLVKYRSRYSKTKIFSEIKYLDSEDSIFQLADFLLFFLVFIETSS
jgi:hypothetical protein